MILKNCPICNSLEVLPLIDEKRFNYSLYKCGNCKFVFKNQISIKYESLAYKEYEKYNYSRQREAREILLIIHKFFPTLTDVFLLEIGSGTGSLLNQFKTFGIKNLLGVEPSKEAYEYAKSTFQINFLNSYFHKSLIKDRYNVILLYDVIEHLSDPKPLISEISEYMVHNDLMIIKTGNTNSFNANLFKREWEYYHSNQHLSFYNRKSLIVLLNQFNLVLVKYHLFKHAYGGLPLFLLVKNIFKSFVLRVLFKISLYVKEDKEYPIRLASDHFIAVIKKR